MNRNIWFQIGRSIVEYYVRHILRADISQEAEFPCGAKILAVNHPSTSDPAFVTALLKEQSSILIKDALFKVPLFGRSLRLAGHIPVVKGNGKAALEEGIRLLKKGRTVIIFPEGEISPEHGLHKGHSGMARMALTTGVPVVPIGISLEYKQLRFVPTRVENQDEPSAWYLLGPYAITVGSPVKYTGNCDNRELVQQVTNEVMGRIKVLQNKGQRRLEYSQRQNAIRTAHANAVLRAARWAKYSVAIRALQSMLFFLIGTAGRV